MSKIHNDHYACGCKDWQTPPEVWKAVLTFIGEERFACDPCSPNSHNVPARIHYTKKQDGLLQPWPTTGHIWVNPPFEYAKEWVKKCCGHFRTNPDCVIWLLLPVRSETKYFQELIYNASSFTFFFQGKLTFGMKGIFKSPAPFPVQLSCYTRDPLAYAKRFEKEFSLKGTVLISPPVPKENDH